MNVSCSHPEPFLPLPFRGLPAAAEAQLEPRPTNKMAVESPAGSLSP